MPGIKTRRRQRYETEMLRVAMDCVFRARTMEELEALLVGGIAEDPHWGDLPAFRRERIDAYVQGALDALARVYALGGASTGQGVGGSEGNGGARKVQKVKSPLKSWV